MLPPVQEFESAETCVDRVLHMEPNNHQAKQLKELITKKMRRGRYMESLRSGCVLYPFNTPLPTDLSLGLGVLGGAALVGGVVAAGAVALLGLGVAKMAKR